MNDTSEKTYKYTVFFGSLNPFCLACKEQDCLVNTDGTCEMIRVYLAAKKLKGKLKKLTDRINRGDE